MAEYLVSARLFRPKRFQDVVGQEAVVTTLQSALKRNRLAHAILFAGSRGTGKTTLARLFATALNCERGGVEPCSQCASCLEIQQGTHLDVLEIDGASHRSIEDIRQIQESISYLPSKGRFKITIIDEVHMLTKEAFNALLKTLEEPPAYVKFLLATTEPHRIPATILSRCLRFQLQRLSPEQVAGRLQAMARELGVEVEEEALALLGRLAEGSLRDGQSLFDQVTSFGEKRVTKATVQEALGLVSTDFFLALDLAAAQSDYARVFRLSEELFTSGKNLSHFLEELTLHFRMLLRAKLGMGALPEAYARSTSVYTEEVLLDILEYLAESEQRLKGALSERVALEMLLLQIVRMPQRLPLEILVERLSALEKREVSLASPPLERKEVSMAASPPERREVSAPPAGQKPPQQALKKEAPPRTEEKASVPASQPLPELTKSELARHDTVMRFAAKELGGLLRKDTQEV